MSNLNPELIEQLNKKGLTLIKNFTKVSSWLKNGKDSEYPLPATIVEFLNEFNSVASTTKEVKTQADTLTSNLDGLTGVIEQLNKQVAEQAQVIAQLQAQLADTQAQLDSAKDKTTSKTTTKTTAKPKTTAKTKSEPAQDNVQLTAQAIDAGEVSEVGLGQIADLINNLVPASQTTQETAQASDDDMDEL